MRRDSLIFALSGIFFGLILGWIIGAQQAAAPPRAATGVPRATASQGSAQGQANAATPPRALDEARLRRLLAEAEARPQDAAVRVELGNLYFDAERFADAIRWYEESLRLDPRNVAASTDLGVSYYYANQPDRALAQFEASLAIDPRHTKTLLNMGIVRAFGKQDLQGAAQAWEQVIALAPESPEGRAARQALEAIRAAHPGVGTAPPGGQGARATP